MNPFEEHERAFLRPTRRERLIAQIQKRGLRLEQYPLHVRVVGPGVDLLAVKLELINVADLHPHTSIRYP